MEPFIEITGLLVMAAVTLRASLSVFWLAQRRVIVARADKRQVKSLSARVSKALDCEHERQENSRVATRPFWVAARQYENADQSICSFYLVPIDGQPLLSFRPGQFLTLELPHTNQQQAAMRCYSISSSPTEKTYYRITVKKLAATENAKASVPPGIFSTFLHDRHQQSDILQVGAPSGSFCVDEKSTRPIIMIAAGVGLTPMVSMIHGLVATRSSREIWLFYGVRNSYEHAMQREVKDLARANPNFRVVTFYSRPSNTCRREFDFEFEGHVTVDAIREMRELLGCEFYVCGPASMMTTVTRDLQNAGVPTDDIRIETFGPALSPQFQPRKRFGPARRAKPVRIHFARSKKTARWTPGTNSILELAEASGVKARFGCRSGNCGTCMAAICDGKIGYVRQPGVEPAAGSCLICIAQPKSDLVIDL